MLRSRGAFHDEAFEEAARIEDCHQLQPGQKLLVRLLDRHDTLHGFDCLTLRLEAGCTWCVVKGRIDVDMRPAPGDRVTIVADEGLVTKLANTTITESRLTRRGMIIVLADPALWEVHARRTRIRVPVSISAKFVSKELAKQGKAIPIPVTISDLCLGGASLTCRKKVAIGNAALLHIPGGRGEEGLTVLCEVICGLVARQGMNHAHKVAVKFAPMAPEAESVFRALTERWLAEHVCKREEDRKEAAAFVEAMKEYMEPLAKSNVPQGFDEDMFEQLFKAA